MTKRLELAGQRFGRWVAIRPATGKDARAYVRWKCRCDCGVTALVARSSLVHKDSLSCGCLRSELASARAITHGDSKSPEYMTWKNMMARCYEPSNVNFQNYGGRGIEVCVEWHDYERFRADMGPRPRGRTIERQENDLGYSKNNCCWATRDEQQSNTRRSRRIEFNGTTRTLTQWAAFFGMRRVTLAYRLAAWGVIPQAFERPAKCGQKIN